MTYQLTIQINNSHKTRRIEAISGDTAIKSIVAEMSHVTGRQRLLPVWAEISASPVTVDVRTDENGENERRSETIGAVEARFDGRIQYAR